MFELIKLITAICFWQKSPKDIPYSLTIWRLFALNDVLISFLVLNMRSYWLYALAQAVFGVLLISSFAWLTLFINGKSSRLCQTSCALLGSDALISFCALPAIATMTLGQGGLLVLLVMSSIIIWQWLVIGHIMREALTQNLGFSLGLAFLYVLSAYILTALLFPDIAGINN